MSKDMTWYDGDAVLIGVNTQEVERRLGDLAEKTPAVVKVAVNAKKCCAGY